jgi:hypothetical protein
MKLAFLAGFLLSIVPGPGTVLADESVVLKGQFNWQKEGEKTHALKGIFTSTGKDKWDVVFNFRWKDKPQEWIGKAEGSLESGNFKGTAERTAGKNTWRYSGKADKGVLKCEHTQTMRDGKESVKTTGSFTLSPVPAEEDEQR